MIMSTGYCSADDRNSRFTVLTQDHAVYLSALL